MRLQFLCSPLLPSNDLMEAGASKQSVILRATTLTWGRRAVYSCSAVWAKNMCSRCTPHSPASIATMQLGMEAKYTCALCR